MRMIKECGLVRVTTLGTIATGIISHRKAVVLKSTPTVTVIRTEGALYDHGTMLLLVQLQPVKPIKLILRPGMVLHTENGKE